MSEPEDPSQRLIEQIQAGKDVQENFRRLVDLHRPRILAFFRKKGFSHEESRDLTQDVFLRVFKGIATFRRESSFGRWLFEISTNVFRNEIRRKRTEKRDAQEESLDAENGPDPSLEDPDPLDGLVERERLRILRQALQELPDQMRLCCLLRYEQGLKYQEIATVMKISIETVKAHLHQAKKRLMEKLGGVNR